MVEKICKSVDEHEPFFWQTKWKFNEHWRIITVLSFLSFEASFLSCCFSWDYSFSAFHPKIFFWTMKDNSKIPHEQTANQSFNFILGSFSKKNTQLHPFFGEGIPSKMVGPLYHLYTYKMGSSFPQGIFGKNCPRRTSKGLWRCGFFSPFFGGWKGGGWWGGWWGMVILKIWIGDGDSQCGGWCWKFGLVVPDSFWGWFFWGNIFHQNQQDPEKS